MPSIYGDDEGGEFDECRDLQSPDGRHKVITDDHRCIYCGEEASTLLEHWCLLLLCTSRTRGAGTDT
ncbi:MAG: hypothetical protein FWF90_16170 [Promicromonosporaceae bacterium]|nr:hypothetical protein [Promicromonosporaceae bacterium]